jgi:hypothetical protein
MPLPQQGTYFESAVASVYAVEWVRGRTVMVVQVPHYTDEMGLIARAMTEEEWDDFVLFESLVPCLPMKPQERPEPG